jgi:Tol biopolymer transport system component
MSQLKFSDLIETAVTLSDGEAVALTLAVADAVAQRGLTELPNDNELILSSTGRVSLESVSQSDEGDKARGSAIPQLAALTRRLLQLDNAESGDRRKRVPGPLLGMLARALTQTVSPAPSPEEFRKALEQFGTPDPTTLAAVFWRAARLRAPLRVPLTTLPSVKVESALAHRAADDRRQNLPPPSELRRYLRETERELFEARYWPERRQATSLERMHTVAAMPLTPAPIITAAVTPALPLPTVRPRPFLKTRFWRVSAGIAATVVGAVLGTVMAFMLAGTVRPASELDVAKVAPPISTPPSVESSANPPAAQASAQPEHSPRAESTVEPLLLATAVGADVFSPSFAPRGRTILFHAGREAAPLMRASLSDTGEVNVDRIETLLDDGAANYHATMSPDGTRIAYDSDRDGVRGVYVANADGSSPRRISGNGYAAVPSWSPDGKRVAFVRAESGRARVWNVWFADPDSGELQRVTNHTLGQPWGASWFPDGQRLAYSLEDRLMVADLRTGLARGYRSPRANRLVRTPAVSPNGRQIVFQVKSDGVWLLDVEEARMRRILADETAEEFVWAPDGGAIAYHARKAGSYGIWRLALTPSGN